MNQKLCALVENGFDYSNLQDLCRMCRASFDYNPTLYATLESIFASLASEYDGQAIAVDRRSRLDGALLPAVARLLNSDDESPRVLLSGLDEIWRTFKSLKDERDR